MNFLNPLYLFGLAAVAVPILIHIFSRRRVPEVPFSTIRFLHRSDRRSMVRINVRRLLLLALRILGIALLALVFARPVVRGGLAALFPAGGSRAACILFDRSYSMGVEGDGGIAFARAKTWLASILDNLKRDDVVSLIFFDTAPEIRYNGEFDRRVVLEAAKETRPSWSGTDLRRAVAAGIRALDESRRDVRELYVISDFQRSALARRMSSGGGAADRGAEAERGGAEAAGDIAQGSARGAEAAGSSAARRLPIRAILLPIQTAAVSNVAVEDVLTPLVPLHKGEIAGMKVVVRNMSKDLSAKFPLEVSVGGRPIMEKEIEIAPGNYFTEELSFPAERVGWVEGVVKKRADRLPADDVRFFTLRVQEKTRVLLIADGGSFYLEQALSPTGSEGDIAALAKGWRSFTTRDLDEHDTVLLGPGGGPQERDIALIDRFVSSGGKAVVLLLPELKDAALRLSSFPLRFEFVEMSQGFFSIRKPDRPPSFLAPFGEDDIRALSRLRFREAAFVSGVPPGAAPLRFTSGNPFVWEERRGEGIVVFAAIDPRPQAGELVLSPYFLPLIQQLVLATGPKTPSSAGSYVGEPILWKGDTAGDLYCQLPDGKSLKPDRAGGGPPAGGGSQPGGGSRPGAGLPAGAGSQPGGGEGALIPPVQTPGFVSIYSSGELRGKIAVNPDCREESDLTFMRAQEAADSLGLSSHLVVEEDNELAPALYSAREGREISMPLLLAAMFVFMIEVIVAQREKGEPS
jgi:hypothetical protein